MGTPALSDYIKKVFPKTLPVMAGYLVLGFGYGLLMESKGYSFVWSILMSITIYGGSMQFVGADLISGGATILSTAIMAVLIQARHIFYGLSMLIKYSGTGRVKPYLIFALTDETYSLVCSEDVPEKYNKATYYFLISIFNQCYWIAGSALGGIFGQIITINTTGVEFSMTALFIVILTENMLKRESRFPSVIGVFISVLCLLMFGPNNFLIPAMIFITISLMVLRPFLSKFSEVTT